MLVENQGRINYGPRLTDPKGIAGGVRLDNQYLHGWEIRPLPLTDLSPLTFTAGPATAAHPAFHRVPVELDEPPGDGFLALPGWTKGVVWLNGFCLGRYWETGPQRTLYAPAPLWRRGRNELVVLELHKPGGSLQVRAEPELGGDGTGPPAPPAGGVRRAHPLTAGGLRLPGGIRWAPWCRPPENVLPGDARGNRSPGGQGADMRVVYAFGAVHARVRARPSAPITPDTGWPEAYAAAHRVRIVRSPAVAPSRSTSDARPIRTRRPPAPPRTRPYPPVRSKPFGNTRNSTLRP
ncbi:hypothetical protein ACWV95_34945 [Streptomyces albus]